MGEFSITKMKRLTRIVLGLTVLLAMLLLPIGQVNAAPVAPALSVTVTPTDLIPAQAGFVHVSGGYPLEISVTLDAAPLNVYWAGDGYLALFAFGFEEPPGEHELVIKAFDANTGARLDTTQTLTVSEYSFPLEQVALPYKLIPLLDRDLNESENARLAAIYGGRTQPDHFDWPFALPLPVGLVTSRFGGNRIYNAGMWQSYHTGTDFRRATGEPVFATADGRVAEADYFDIRGNMVILDHGYGVFSHYAHLSEYYVTPGSFVRQGEIIGAAGGTGRSNGPHLHYEIVINGVSVDPIRWLALNPDFIPPRELLPGEQTGS